MISVSNKLIKSWRIASIAVLSISSLLLTVSVQAATPLSQGHIHRLYHSTALNWSGYAAAANLTNPQVGSATDVKGSWQVPNLTCDTDGYTSTWVGLDGYNSQSVEQIGVESECHSGQASYYVWYEMYPHPMRLITTNVHPGDNISAEVKASGNTFRLTLANATTHRSYSTYQILRKAAKSSAEWIVEAPSNYLGQVLPLANYGQVDFTAASATINSQVGSITSFANDPLTMVNASNQPISVPFDLSSDGTAFSVKYQ